MFHYFQQSLPIQGSSTSCMDNCSNLLIYLSATIFGLLHLFSSHQLECSFNNWKLKDVIPLFDPHPPMAHSVKQSLTSKLAPLSLWSYLLPSTPPPTQTHTMSFPPFCQYARAFVLTVSSTWSLLPPDVYKARSPLAFAQISLYQGSFTQF